MAKTTKLFFSLFFTLIISPHLLSAQTYLNVTADTVRVVNGELIIDNSTSSIKGVLINVGNGVTRFEKLGLANIGDTAIAITGQDTLKWNMGSTTGRYYVLSRDIPITTHDFYHPTAFEAPLDSGKLYQIHALIYLRTKQDYDTISTLRAQYSDTSLNDEIGIFNVGVDTTNNANRYFLEYNKLIKSTRRQDTFKLSFKTDITDPSGNMTMDSLSYLYVEEVAPKVSSPYYTVDSSGSTPLDKDEYYVLDSVRFNFTPLAQNVPGWVDVVGDPSKGALTATASDGITISTVSPALWSPNSHGASAIMGGNTYVANDDPYPFKFDTAVTRSGFINTSSQFNGHDYNIHISGLNKDHLYRLQMLGSISQEYRVDSLGDPDVYGIRSLYRLSDGRFASLTVNSNTSNTIVFDTVKPGTDGEIDISVAGQDSTYSKGSTGTISALEILDISKEDTAVAGRTVFLSKHYFDTLLYVNDGVVDNRLVIVYKPKNYDPNKSYPILIGLGGQESAIGTDWDYQMILQQNLGLTVENNKGDIYGIDENGDTTRFITLLPQAKLSEWSIPPAQVYTIIQQFKAMHLYNTNNDLYLAGSSSGAQQVTNFAFTYPRITTAVFAADPAQNFSSSELQMIRDSAGVFVQSGGRFLLSDHGDIWGENCDTIAKYLGLAGGHPYYRRFQIGHIGFALEYKMNAVDEVYGGNLYDWLTYRPTVRYAEFLFGAPDPRSLDWNTFTDKAGAATRPFTSIMYGSDYNTGWGANSVDPSRWDYYTSTSGGTVYAGNYENFKFHINYFILGGGYRAKGSYNSRGPNLQITGLAPYGKYHVLFIDYLDSSKIPGYRTEYTMNGVDSISFDNYQSYNTTLFPRLTGYANASGNINIGVYPDTKSPYNSQYGALEGFIVVEDSIGNYHWPPKVDAGGDDSIMSPVTSVSLSGTVQNINGVGGSIISTLWTVISKPAGTSPIIASRGSLQSQLSDLDSIGTYKIELSATDDSGYVGRDTVIITVNQPSAPLSVGDRILIDLGGATAGHGTVTTSPQPDGRYWNTLGDPAGSPNYSSFVDTAGNTVGMAVFPLGSWYNYGTNIDGGNSSGVGDYPSSATIDSWLTHQGDVDSLLIYLPAGTYSIKFWGSRTGASGLITGIKLNTQSTYTTYDAGNNSDYNNAAVFTGVVSDGGTPIVFNLDASSSSNAFGYYGVMDIRKTSN